MRGIRCAFTGRVAQDPELKTSKSGNPFPTFSVAVDEASEESTTWIGVAVFSQLATELYPGLKKGTEVYCEGRLRLDSWTGRDGRERSGLSVAASRVDVLGRIAFDPTSCKPELAPVDNPRSRDTAVARRRTYPSDDSLYEQRCHLGCFWQGLLPHPSQDATYGYTSDSPRIENGNVPTGNSTNKLTGKAWPALLVGYGQEAM